MSLFSRLWLLPMALAIGSSAFAGPVVEARSAGNPAASAAVTDLSVAVFEQLQQFQSQIEVLTGRVEQLEHDLRQAREQERARYMDLDGRIVAMEKAAEKAAAEKTAVNVVPADAAPAAAAETDSEQVFFDRALALVRDKKYDDAIPVFEQQLKRFPRGELVPATLYWLGEMWQVATAPDVPKAGRYFYRVYNEYPKSTRASAAMYRHGLIQCLDDVAKGRVTLNKVLVQHPGSADAVLAEAALKNQCK